MGAAGHRAGGFVDSLVRKGVRRQEAKSIVGAATRELSAQLTLSGLFHVAGAGLAALIALLLHSPQVLGGEPVGPVNWGNPGVAVIPFALIAVALAGIGFSRFLRVLSRWVCSYGSAFKGECAAPARGCSSPPPRTARRCWRR